MIPRVPCLEFAAKYSVMRPRKQIAADATLEEIKRNDLISEEVEEVKPAYLPINGAHGRLESVLAWRKKGWKLVAAHNIDPRNPQQVDLVNTLRSMGELGSEPAPEPAEMGIEKKVRQARAAKADE